MSYQGDSEISRTSPLHKLLKVLPLHSHRNLGYPGSGHSLKAPISPVSLLGRKQGEALRVPLGVVRAVQISSENSEENPELLETQPSSHAIKGASNSPGTRQLNPSRGVPSAAPHHPGERDRAQRPALGFGPQEPEQRTRGSQRRARRGEIEPNPPGQCPSTSQPYS